MIDRISAKERLANPYHRQMAIDTLLGLVSMGLVILFIWQVVVDITN